MREATMNNSPGELDLSIVLTLMDDRGRTAECVSSWTQAQTFPRDRYEVILVASGREPEVEARARPALTARDHMLRYAGANELALHHFGAQRSHGKWLLFTEAHCAARPDCLAELMAYLLQRQGQIDGACIRTLSDGNCNRVARLEERWYNEGFAGWSREDDWRKVTIRGTAVRRDAYEKVGGFKSEFGCFGEIFLAAELDTAGYRLGYVPTAAVKHYNGTDLDEVLSYIRDYRAGEVLCQSQYSNAAFEGYFGWSRGWVDADRAYGRLGLRCAALSLRQAIVHPLRQGSPAMARAMLAVVAQRGWDALTRGRAALLRPAVAYAWWRALFAWPWLGDDERYRRYCRLWAATGDLARQRALLRQGSVVRTQDGKTPPTLEYRPGLGPSANFIGFHARENFNGQPFRWSGCLALVRVCLPRGNYDVTIDTDGLRDCHRPGTVECFLNGRRLPRRRAQTTSEITFHADPATLNAGNEQCLILTSGRLRTAGSAERRALGIPIFAITFVRVEPSAGTGRSDN